MLEQNSTPEDRELTTLIRDEADRICNLVDRMDVFSDSGPLQREAVNIHQVLDRVMQLAKNGFGKHLRYVTDFDPSLPPVLGNRDQLVQVFLTLVKNAAEAAPKEGGESQGRRRERERPARDDAHGQCPPERRGHRGPRGARLRHRPQAPEQAGVSFDPGLPDDSINVSRTHPLKEAGLLLAGMIGAVILFVIAVGASIDWLAPLLPPGLEMKLLGSFGEPDEDEIEPSDSDEQRLQALVDRLASHWADNPYSFRAAILGDDAPNAFAFPGGWIVVSRGLLEQTDSENELAFVVSHEIGHFKNRDHLRGLGRGVALALAMSVVASSGAGLAGDLAGLAGSLASRSFDRDPEVDADAVGLGLVYA